MQSKNQHLTNQKVLTVQPSDRWQIYNRLQDLDIYCQCAIDKPLEVKVDDILTAIQLWSVTKQVTASRIELVHWLNQCWRIKQ